MPFGYNFIAFDNHIINAKMNIWKCALPFAPLCSEAFSASAKLRVVADRVFRDKPVDRTLITLVPDLFKKVLGYLANDFVGAA